MIAILIFAILAAMCQATPVVYSRPAATVLVQPAPVAYSSPIVLKAETPKPYSFGYEAPAIGGGSSRHETSDGAGRVSGSYTVSDADGRLRVVDYYADETGFHANVKTNEPGTANQDSADVSVQSYAAPVEHPVVAPKVVAAPAPVYTVAAPPVRTVAVAPVRTVARRYLAPAPVTYSVSAPAYNTLSYASPAYNTLNYASPITYSNGYYGHASYDQPISYYYK